MSEQDKVTQGVEEREESNVRNLPENELEQLQERQGNRRQNSHKALYCVAMVSENVHKQLNEFLKISPFQSNRLSITAVYHTHFDFWQESHIPWSSSPLRPEVARCTGAGKLYPPSRSRCWDAPAFRDSKSGTHQRSGLQSCSWPECKNGPRCCAVGFSAQRRKIVYSAEFANWHEEAEQLRMNRPSQFLGPMGCRGLENPHWRQHDQPISRRCSLGHGHCNVVHWLVLQFYY